MRAAPGPHGIIVRRGNSPRGRLDSHEESGIVANRGKQKPPQKKRRIKTHPKPEKDLRKNPPLTMLQTRFLEALPSSKTPGEAAVKAGHSAKNPIQTGYQALKALRGRVSEILDRIGLDEETVIYNNLQSFIS